MSEALLIEPVAHAPTEEAEERRQQIIASVLAGGLSRARERLVPAATYRLQFNAHYHFADATRLVPYLQSLGITHAYASPYLASTAGSTHGYDIINPQLLNPEIGSPEEFHTWVRTLREAGLGHILDFVPNHMGVGTDANPWWQDVLENGTRSAYATFFDIDWHPLKLDLANKVLLPVLGDQFGRVLENQELRLEYEQGAFYLRYYDRRFPITPKSYFRILIPGLDKLSKQLGPESEPFAEYQSILTAIHNLPNDDISEQEHSTEQEREKEVIKRRLRRLCEETPICGEHIQENVETLNGISGEPHSFDALEELLHDQHYRLAYWKVASDEINYRRFFDVNALAALCMEQHEVFEKSHALVLRLIAEGHLDGLRIDHADGLYDPAGYLRQLQIERILQLCHAQHAESTVNTTDVIEWTELEPELRRQLQAEKLPHDLQPLYVVAEKILERHERLPADWVVAGTTGYDFLNDLNGIFIANENEVPLKALYARFIASKDSFDELAYHAKRLIMKVSMASEIHVLGHQLDRISEGNRLSCDFTLNGLTSALREIIACFPVYRTYVEGDVVTERDRKYIQQAVARAKRRNPATYYSVFDFIQTVLLLQGLAEASEQERELRRKFVRKFQQFTGPVMAKSMEDTVFYRYNLLVSLNEVGGDPKRFGFSLAAFHQQNQHRQAQNPYGLLATSTHDTKRSEDVRARINVLSEIPAAWKDHAMRWTRWNKRKKTKLDGESAPSRNDEYLLYQTLIGTWPVGGEICPAYSERICRYMIKAIREAKEHSSWIAPNEEYERALIDFVNSILCTEPKTAFLADLEPFANELAQAGYWNSLAQTLLKITSPGVPDIYPGTEIWNLRLVDPDNREPVDFDQLKIQLDALQSEANGSPTERSAWLQDLIQSAADGRIKHFVLCEALKLRQSRPTLFTDGEYLPLEVEGPQAKHLVAFARVHQEEAVIVVVPRLLTTLTKQIGGSPCGGDLWNGAHIRLPASLAARSWEHLYTRQQVHPNEQLEIRDFLAEFPVGLLIAR